MLNIIIYYLVTIRYKDKFNNKMKQMIDGFVSGLSDFLIIALLILYFTKQTNVY